MAVFKVGPSRVKHTKLELDKSWSIRAERERLGGWCLVNTGSPAAIYSVSLLLCTHLFPFYIVSRISFCRCVRMCVCSLNPVWIGSRDFKTRAFSSGNIAVSKTTRDSFLFCENVIVYMHACVCVHVWTVLQLNLWICLCAYTRIPMCFPASACVLVCIYVSLCVGVRVSPILLFIGGSEKWWKVWREMGQWWHSLMFTPSGYGCLYITSIHHKAASSPSWLSLPLEARCPRYMC